MKLSVHLDLFKDTIKGRLINNCRILLNGNCLMFCQVADEEEGFVIVYRSHDKKVYDGSTERLTGVVDIVDLRYVDFDVCEP